jgi:hypothetical protein
MSRMWDSDRGGTDWSGVMSIPISKARRALLMVILGTICLGVASMVATTLTEFESWSLQSVGAATLIAACLLIVAGRTLEKRRLRAASIMAICVIVVEYLLVLASFWHDKLPMLDAYGSQCSTLMMCIPIADNRSAQLHASDHRKLLKGRCVSRINGTNGTFVSAPDARRSRRRTSAESADCRPCPGECAACWSRGNRCRR